MPYARSSRLRRPSLIGAHQQVRVHLEVGAQQNAFLMNSWQAQIFILTPDMTRFIDRSVHTRCPIAPFTRTAQSLRSHSLLRNHALHTPNTQHLRARHALGTRDHLCAHNSIFTVPAESSAPFRRADFLTVGSVRLVLVGFAEAEGDCFPSICTSLALSF